MLLATVLGGARLGGVALARFNWYWFYTPLFVALVAMLAAGPTFVGRLLSGRLAALLGEASYGLYLLHYPALWLLLLARGVDEYAVVPSGIPMQPLDGLTFTAIAGAVFASLLSYRFAETPARRWLRGRPAVRLPAHSPVAHGHHRSSPFVSV
jgi:peptidoglycan/LPS O-acetylase OafA/YrhL